MYEKKDNRSEKFTNGLRNHGRVLVDFEFEAILLYLVGNTKPEKLGMTNSEQKDG